MSQSISTSVNELRNDVLRSVLRVYSHGLRAVGVTIVDTTIYNIYYYDGV